MDCPSLKPKKPQLPHEHTNSFVLHKHTVVHAGHAHTLYHMHIHTEKSVKISNAGGATKQQGIIALACSAILTTAVQQRAPPALHHWTPGKVAGDVMQTNAIARVLVTEPKVHCTMFVQTQHPVRHSNPRTAFLSLSSRHKYIRTTVRPARKQTRVYQAQ